MEKCQLSVRNSFNIFAAIACLLYVISHLHPPGPIQSSNLLHSSGKIIIVKVWYLWYELSSASRRSERTSRTYECTYSPSSEDNQTNNNIPLVQHKSHFSHLREIFIDIFVSYSVVVFVALHIEEWEMLTYIPGQ